jgi:CubicO group peptidase (beta-lactamase class C family)
MSLSDYGRFLQLNLNALRGTETKFLSVATARRLHASPMQDEYALGWGTFQIDGVRSSTHAGSGGRFYALVALQPGRDVGVAVVANSAGERTRDASDAVLNALLGPCAAMSRSGCESN